MASSRIGTASAPAEAWGELTMNPFANPEKPVLGIAMGCPRGKTGVPVDGHGAQLPAAAAGLRPGDVITSLDGSESRTPTDSIKP